MLKVELEIKSRVVKGIDRRSRWLWRSWIVLVLRVRRGLQDRVVRGRRVALVERPKWLWRSWLLFSMMANMGPTQAGETAMWSGLWSVEQRHNKA